MKTLFMVSVLALVSAACSAPRVPWHPAPGPLMTRWGREVDPEHVLSEYPRPQLERAQWLNLNGMWQFAAARGDEAPPFGRDLTEHILVPFPIESSLSGIARRAERAWYRREIEIPRGWKHERVLLHFGAVDWEARVYVNGKLCAEHRGGYDPFTVDVTDALKASGAQELIVGVFDPTDECGVPRESAVPQESGVPRQSSAPGESGVPGESGLAQGGGVPREAGDQPRGKQVRKPEGIWYTPSSGIWQTVWLEPVPEFRIESLRLDPLTNVSALRLRASSTDNTVRATIEAVAYDHGREVGRVRGRPNTDLLLALPGAHRWSPSDPFLYDLEVTLRDGDRTEDSVKSYFGMRSIEVAKDEDGVPRIALNGTALFEIGLLDQGFWPDGLYTAPSDAALRSDIERMKELGFNLARKHVKVEPERWYYWCDKLGLLVWQDMPSGDNKTPESKKEFELELDHVIAALRNHPAIITWVVFNEGWGQFDTARLAQHVKDLDPSRLVSNASGWTDEKCGDLSDVHVYPGPGAPKIESVRAGVLGEFGGLGLAIPEHTWEAKSWGYRGVGDRDDLTLGYEGLLRRTYELRDTAGLCAAVYTQLTDVETECNGLMTYDREIVKPDVTRTSAANRGEFKPLETLVPSSSEVAQRWRYRFDAPVESPSGPRWFDARFDDSTWKEGPGGFGTSGTPGAIVGTEWKTNDIWLRRTFTLASLPHSRAHFLAHHDEDVEIYVNGILAARAGGYTTTYELLSITAEGRAALKPGANVLAVHCKQTTGGQYIDVGLVIEKD